MQRKVISFRLEEVGITHIRNKEVILRISLIIKIRRVNDFTNFANLIKL
jgi:hexosaminidase